MGSRGSANANRASGEGFCSKAARHSRANAFACIGLAMFLCGKKAGKGMVNACSPMCKRTLAAILPILLLFSLTACQFLPALQSQAPGGAPQTPPEPFQTASSSSADLRFSALELDFEPVAVEFVTVELSGEDVVRGSTLSPNIVILPADATDKSYKLWSSDETVLRLRGGNWTAVGVGTAELVATAANGVSGAATITVIAPVESVSLGGNGITMSLGDSATLHPVISPPDALLEQSVYYTSSDDSVAAVSEDGIILAVGVGTAVIECTIDGISATCIVTVIVPVTGISVNIDRNIYRIGEQGSFSIEIMPENATDKSFSISISGAASTVGEYSFSCDIGGEAIITVTAANGISSSRALAVVDLTAFADEVFRLTNAERASEGVPPLSEKPSLTQVAAVRANEIIRHFSHDRPDGRSCFTAYDDNNVTYRWAGENIAMGQKTPAEVVRAWMDSPGHRENILKREFGHMGVSIALDGNGKLHWSQNFTD